MCRMEPHAVVIMNVKAVEIVFLTLRSDRFLVCPYCGEEPDMEIGPDEEMPQISEDAKLVKMLEGEEEIEKYDQLLSLAVTGGDYNWI